MRRRFVVLTAVPYLFLLTDAPVCTRAGRIGLRIVYSSLTVGLVAVAVVRGDFFDAVAGMKNRHVLQMADKTVFGFAQ